MARQITEEIVKAFMNGTNKKISNSEVHADCTGVYMYLFGNLIAERVGERLRITLAGWNTVTTRERLNGIPRVSISQKKGRAYLNGEPMEDDAWYIVK